VRNRNPWANTSMVALTVALGASLAVPPVWAADASPRADRIAPLSSASVAKTGMRGPEPARAAQAPAATASASTESKPFFKSTKGAVAIVLMAGVMAYTIHSRTCCAIHSPSR
jgi:hypothetical protein